MSSLLPEAVRRIAAWCVVALLVTGVAAVGVWLCVVFKTAVTPVLLALLGTALLGPLYRRLLRMRVQRSLAAGLTCAAVLAVVGGATYIVVKALIDTGGQIVDSLKNAAHDLSKHFGAAGTSLDDLASNSKDLLGKFGGTAASGVVSGLSVVGEMIATAVLALLLVFFFLRDSHKAAGTLRSLVPAHSGDTVEAMARRAFTAVEGFMRGTTFIALIDAVCITVGLLILRVPGAWGLGALVFVGAYIPYLGAFLSGAIAILVALADRGLVIALWALGVVLAVQVLEGHVLQPMIQSRTVQMHPAVVMLAITAGASVAGIIGMLLAVPLTAAAFGVVSELRARYAEKAAAAPGPSSAEAEPS
ncbi:AI-2E family transporter [Streptomyces spectabilis]|uniref:AI-2E family transporter n=1 Tax=Streptomyces spectabilis TaxID=68270 RepID=A0A5P2XEY3_STRST|nr:AI-2E family transporter [Streptomyces spectabilis]MBB5103833.1 putative PurR-regulated permease PerM [Streptomyces spectabilis]MCI3903929.1 AI-2E family transporter [Streptomyces spectabilis]QEV61086.1 AI-2E family transporter [Streptomyces spectabilis]GGV18508.1 AI-2E family transporter [Streptomyces spectabilis]